jgi:anti-sigma factor RsiW
MMDHAQCHELLSSLSEYVDGTLGDELCLEIKRHLNDCDDCRVVVDTLRKTIYLYHASTTLPFVPEEVRERLYRRLALDDFLEKGAHA